MLGAEVIPWTVCADLPEFAVLADLAAFAGLAVRPADPVLADGNAMTFLAAKLKLVVHAERSAFAVPTLILASVVWAFPRRHRLLARSTEIRDYIMGLHGTGGPSCCRFGILFFIVN